MLVQAASSSTCEFNVACSSDNRIPTPFLSFPIIISLNMHESFSSMLLPCS